MRSNLYETDFYAWTLVHSKHKYNIKKGLLNANTDTIKKR